MATKKTESSLIEIKALDIQRVDIKIVGDTPLIVHKWSEKAKREMLEKQLKVTKTKAKEARDPYADFLNSMYWLTEQPKENTPDAFETAIKNGAKFGFPVGSVKQCANSAAYRLGWVQNQMSLRGAYFLETEWGKMFEIKGCIPEMREDTVKIGMGTSDLRYRAEFRDWYAEMTLIYNASGSMTLEQILNCISAGGFCTGLGEWRPEKDGDNGRFHIETI